MPVVVDFRTLGVQISAGNWVINATVAVLSLMPATASIQPIVPLVTVDRWV